MMCKRPFLDLQQTWCAVFSWIFVGLFSCPDFVCGNSTNEPNICDNICECDMCRQGWSQCEQDMVGWDLSRETYFWLVVGLAAAVPTLSVLVAIIICCVLRKRRAATATATVEVSERSPTTPQKAAKPRKPRKAKKAANGKKATREDWKPTSRKSLVSSALYVDGCSLGGQHYDAFRKNPDDDNPYSELYEIQVIYDN